MSTEITYAAREWAAEHPDFVAAVTTLEQHGVRTAVFSSAYHHIVCRAFQLPSLRPPGDIDLLVMSDQFDMAADLLGGKIHLKQVTFPTGDGHDASFIAREVVVHIGGDEVQFMDPLGSLAVGPFEYQTAYTDHAARARMVVETRQGLLPLAHMVDTIGMYAIIQRGGIKNDAHNAATLLRAYDSLLDAYATERARHMGWNTRVWEFIKMAQQAAHTQSGAHLPAAQSHQAATEPLVQHMT